MVIIYTLLIMIIINIIDAPVGGISYCKIVINSVKSVVLQINPKKFKHIKNKTIPSPLRPKFRNKSESNIYFLSKSFCTSFTPLITVSNKNFILIERRFYARKKYKNNWRERSYE